MKKIFYTFLLTFICVVHLNAQNSDAKKQTNAAVKSHTWVIEKADNGASMNLIVPFTPVGKKDSEYINLIVYKAKSNKRPDISVLITGKLDEENGVILDFATSVKGNNGQMKMEPVKGTTIRVKFKVCLREKCVAMMLSGYSMKGNDGTYIDVFANFLKYDQVIFNFAYTDGSKKSVAVPLDTFKKQYKEL